MCLYRICSITCIKYSERFYLDGLQEIKRWKIVNESKLKREEMEEIRREKGKAGESTYMESFNKRITRASLEIVII